jgi:hypothetical protein
LVIDRAGLSHRRLQEPIKPPVVFDKKLREHSRLPCFWLYHQSTPIMDSPRHNIDLVLESPAVSLGMMVCLVNVIDVMDLVPVARPHDQNRLLVLTDVLTAC